MAVPTLLTKEDYSSVDFTSKKQGTFEVLKDAIINKFGWNLEYEDNASDDKSFVVSNNGTGSSLKFILENDSGNYLKCECSQSWSDINTPVNMFRSMYFDVGEVNSNFLLVGDEKRFYYLSFFSKDSSESDNPVFMFFGDVITYNDNDPNGFIITPQSRSTVQFDDNKNSSSSYPGAFLDQYVNTAMTYSNSRAYVYSYDNTQCSIIQPGVHTGLPSSSTLNMNEMPISNPTVLTEIYLTHKEVDPVTKGLKVIGKFPGLAMCITLSKLVGGADRGANINVSNEACITIPTKDYWNIGVVRLTDWDLL